MARVVNRMNTKLIIKLMSEVAENKRLVALFNNVDIPVVKELVAKAKVTKFAIRYGCSGCQVTLEP